MCTMLPFYAKKRVPKNLSHSLQILYRTSKAVVQSNKSNNEENTNDDAACPPTKMLRCDPLERLHGGFKIHKLALFPATEKKIQRGAEFV